MALCGRSKGRALHHVLNAAIQSGKLTGDQCVALCGMVNGKLTDDALAYVLNMVIKSGKLTDPQREGLKAMASDNGVALE